MAAVSQTKGALKSSHLEIIQNNHFGIKKTSVLKAAVL
jgi:hypothetical protein